MDQQATGAGLRPLVRSIEPAWNVCVALTTNIGRIVVDVWLDWDELGIAVGWVQESTLVTRPSEVQASLRVTPFRPRDKATLARATSPVVLWSTSGYLKKTTLSKRYATLRLTILSELGGGSTFTHSPRANP
jgi:hypothetical protein